MGHKSNRVSWSLKEPQGNILLESQDCDEVHITRDKVIIIYGEDKKEKVFDTVKIKDVTFYSKSSQTSSNSGNSLSDQN